MRRRKKFALGLAGTLLAASAGSALALDTREVVVEKSEGLAEVPRHLGHVLANPNRNFSFEISPEHAEWRVLKSYERKGVYRERLAYLEHADNLFHQTTYFRFDEDEPIGPELVATRLRHQLGPLSVEGLRFVVVGHADEVGTQAYNKALSLRRARAVAALLVAAGYDETRLEVIGRGKLDPVSFTDQARNRRVDVVVRGDKDARLAYKKMKQGGALTCRDCIVPAPAAAPLAPRLDASAPIGREATRQPTVPTSNANAQTGKEATATIKALQQLSDASKAISGADAETGGFRADQTPPGGSIRGTVPAPSLQDILGQSATPFQRKPDFGDQ